MIKKEEKYPVVLTLYPNNIGLAYVVCEGMHNVLDEGIQKISPISNHKFIKHTKWFMDYAQPEIVILREENLKDNQIAPRTKKVVKKMKDLAEERNLKVFQYSRTQVKEVFSQFNVTKKYGISRKITEWYKHLKPKTPHYRSITKSEHYHAGVFDAFALMITHFYIHK